MVQTVPGQKTELGYEGKIQGRVREEETREGRVGVREGSLEEIFVIDCGSSQFRETATVFYYRVGVEISAVGSEDTEGKVKVTI